MFSPLLLVKAGQRYRTLTLTQRIEQVIIGLHVYAIYLGGDTRRLRWQVNEYW
jgi:hypothetical protein